LEVTDYSNVIEVFNNVNKSIPVYIPAGSKNRYQNAAGWREFKNLKEMK